MMGAMSTKLDIGTGRIDIRHAGGRPGRLRLAVLFLLACLSGAQGQLRAGEVSPPRPVRLHVAGKPFKIGEDIGKELAGKIRTLRPLLLGVAILITGKSKAELHALCRKLAEKLAAEDVAEMRGVAKGAGASYEDVLFLNMFYSVVYDGPACRQLAVWGKRSKSGELLHARNLDWFDYPGGLLRKNHTIVNVRPEKGVEYLFLTWPGLQAVLTGTNRKGITVGFNGIGSRKWRIAEPVFFTLKRVLRTCGSIEEAVALMKKARPLGNGSVLISDAVRKKAVVVELCEGKIAVRKSTDSMIGNANHYTTEAWGKPPRGYPRGKAGWPTCSAARKQGEKLAADDVKRVMSAPSVLQRINLLSVVFRPAANKMLLACGKEPAAAGKFREYPLFPKKADRARQKSAAAPTRKTDKP